VSRDARVAIRRDGLGAQSVSAGDSRVARRFKSNEWRRNNLQTRRGGFRDSLRVRARDFAKTFVFGRFNLRGSHERFALNFARWQPSGKVNVYISDFGLILRELWAF
jgi:hypothetical protein